MIHTQKTRVETATLNVKINIKIAVNVKTWIRQRTDMSKSTNQQFFGHFGIVDFGITNEIQIKIRIKNADS